MKASYAQAKQAKEKKAAELDEVRQAARALHVDLHEKFHPLKGLLKEQETKVTQLVVSYSDLTALRLREKEY